MRKMQERRTPFQGTGVFCLVVRAGWPSRLSPLNEAGFAFGALRLSWSRRLLTDATRRAGSAEPALYAEPNPGPDSENKNGPRKEGHFVFLVAGA